IKLKIPDTIAALLQELRLRNDYGARWIAFSLLNLSHDGLARLNHFLQHLRTMVRSAGQLFSSVFVDNGLVMVVTMARLANVEDLRKVLIARLTVEKYRRQADTAIGFAIEL